MKKFINIQTSIEHIIVENMEVSKFEEIYFSRTPEELITMMIQ